VETLEDILSRLVAALPGAGITIQRNESPCAQHSLVIEPAFMVAAARFLQQDAALRFDYCSNVTGVDWLDAELSEKVKVKKLVEGVEKEVEEVRKTKRAGYLEVVYHLYSMEKKQGPLIIRVRSASRADPIHVPSLTPVWRSCEFQEREVFDLYGIIFDGHPDLRRLLMWDEFKDHPMRKDYAEPDDYEYEPTPHDDVLARAQPHYPKPAAS
jgi:NADH-quinone oxidoreductase subunit C